MSQIKTFPDRTPKSNTAIIEIIRGWLDKAYDQKVTFIQIEGIVDGEVSSISFTCRYTDENCTIQKTPDK